MEVPTNFDKVLKIGLGHIRYGLYLGDWFDDEDTFYWFLHESPYKKEIGEKADEEEAKEFKAHVALRIEHPDQLRAMGKHMLRCADAMEEYILDELKKLNDES